MKNALWVAVYAGFPKVVEQLVGYGADLNAANEDGERVLHMLLAGCPQLNMRPVSGDMTQLKKVQSEEAYFIVGQYVLFHSCVMQIHDELLHLNFGKPVESYVTVACFLVCEGADRYIRERNYGVTPCQVCPPEVGAIVTTFQRRNR